MPDLGEVEGTTLTEIFSERVDEVDVPIGRIDTNPVFFKKFQITNTTSPLQRIRFVTGALNAAMRTNAGLGSIEFGFFESTDGGASFDSIFRVSQGGTSYTALDAGTGNFFVNANSSFIALCVICLNGSVSGKIKEHKITITLDIPPGITIKRVQ